MMNYEFIKNELIKLKKEELSYIDNIANISSNKILSESEKLEIYRALNNYQVNLTKMFKTLFYELTKDKESIGKNYDEAIIEFDIDEKFLSSVKFDYEEQKKHILNDLGINAETFKFKLSFRQLLYIREGYRGINLNIILNKQKLIEEPIYIFSGYYDAAEECYGPCLGERDTYLYGIYENICSSAYNNDKKEVPKKDIDEFAKDKMIIHSKRYVHSYEIKGIFEEELLNTKNRTLHDCVIQTKNKIEELNYTRSPEYKEKVLLERINELYKKGKEEFIQNENNVKNSVIVIAITQDKEYIITFQKKIKDKIIAEFPSGYIEKYEDLIEAAKRTLQEETGYVTDDLFIVDEAYTSLGVDNSVTYIVIANNCIKTDESNINSTKLVNYGLFSEIELKYLINKNIMNDAINKLAYYNLVHNVDDCNRINTKENKKIYKKQQKKTNPLDNSKS